MFGYIIAQIVSMNKTLIFFLLLFSLNSGHFLLFGSEEKNLFEKRIDSLEMIAQDSDLPDTVRVDALLRLTWDLKSNNPGRALEFGKRALQKAESLEDDSKIAGALSRIGVVYWQLGNFNMALDFHLEANSIYQRLGDNIGIARSLTNIGLIFLDQGHYEKALEYFFDAYPLYEEKDNLQGLAPVLNNIGLVYQYQRDYELAQTFHLRSLEIKNTLSDEKSRSFSLNNLGAVSKNTGDFESALDYFSQALNIRQSIGDKREIANTLRNIGNLFLVQNALEPALENLNEALDLYYEVDDQSGIARTYNYLGKARMQAGEMEEADELFHKSLEISANIGITRMIAENYQCIAALMAENENFKKAYEYQARHYELRDSIYSEESRRRIVEMQIMHDRERKESEMELVRVSRQRDAYSIEKQRILKNFLLVGVILVLILLFLLYSRYLFVNKANKLLEKQKEEITQSNKKLLKLNKNLIEQKQKVEDLNQKLNQANQKLINSEKHLIETNLTKDKFFSIISHDLRNPFASIVSFSRILKRDINNLDKDDLQELALELDKSVFKINNLLENLLHWSRAQTGKINYRPEYLPLKEIIQDNVNLFVNSSREKEIEIQDKIEDDIIVWADKNMTSTVLRNLISNALKYTEPGGKIKLTSSSKNGKAYISVIDNGVGISPENVKKLFRLDSLHSTYGTRDEKGSGLGLLLCKEFVEKQGGNISLESKKGKGSVFTFSLPFEEEAAEN